MSKPRPPFSSFRFVTRRVHGIRCRRQVFGTLALAAFLGGWVVDVGGFHGCPHHDLSDTVEAHGHPEHGAHGLGEHGLGEHGLGEHGQAGHASASHAHGEPSDSDEPSHSHHHGPCTCRADCTGAAPVRAATAPTVGRAPQAVPVRRVEAAPLLLPARFHLPHILPWPTAPPRV